MKMFEYEIFVFLPVINFVLLNPVRIKWYYVCFISYVGPSDIEMRFTGSVLVDEFF